MIDYFLKFQDEQEANSTLYGEDGTPLAAAIDTIGTISLPGMQTDEEGNPIMEQVPGWHVNVRCAEPIESLAPFAVQVETPIRVWA